jgi:hypothetical protein
VINYQLNFTNAVKKQIKPLRDKDKDAFKFKVETAINELSLENCFNLPDWVIAEYLTEKLEDLHQECLNRENGAMFKELLKSWRTNW